MNRISDIEEKKGKRACYDLQFAVAFLKDHICAHLKDFSALMLAAGFITGENICIDGGMTKLMIYHDDHGWTYKPEGCD